jgi:hypothetical protein
MKEKIYDFFNFLEKDGYINSPKFTRVAFFVGGLAATLALVVPYKLILSVFICFMVLVFALWGYMWWYFSKKQKKARQQC